MTGLPSWHPPLAVLEIAELVLAGALAQSPTPIVPPAELAAAEIIVLEDAEGTPVATLDRTASGPEFGALRPFAHGPLRAARRTPARIRAELHAMAPTDGSGKVLAVPVQSVLSAGTVDAVLARAADSDRPVLWLAVFGAGRPSELPPGALWRAVRAVAQEAAKRGVHSIAVPVAVPLLSEPPARGKDALLDEAVPDEAVPDEAVPDEAVPDEAVPDGAVLDEAVLDEAVLDEAVLDGAGDDALLAAVARSYGGTEVANERLPRANQAIGSPDEATARPGEVHPIFARERERAVRPPHRRGVTIFFTGLSGSGKSTVARALAQALGERSDRTVSLLDGDEVRRLLSAGLGFSRADRDLNIRRIGFVAAEVTRHGGIAICAPIAPFAQARAQVRAAVEELGDFVLIHISTPLAECERRDRKGLYAKARQGLIPDFTGISSPYEVPTDADLRLDTSRLSVSDAVAAVWSLLSARGYISAEPDREPNPIVSPARF